MTIKLDNKTLKEIITSVDKPVLYINKIVFVTTDKNWAQRLFGASLTIKFSCIDKNNKENKTSQEPLVFGAFITPYHIQPVMEVNRLFYFIDNVKMPNDSQCESWQTTIEINNIELTENERIEIFSSDNQKRATTDEIINEIEKLKKEFDNLNFSTQTLLRLIPHFRLDWSQDDNEFSDEFNIGVTKPILLSGLANSTHKIKSNNLLFENSKLAKLLVDTFLVEKKLSVSLLKEIHQYIIKDGGEFRTQNVIIGDRRKLITPPFSEVSQIPANLESLILWYNTEIAEHNLHPLFTSSIFHYNLVKIHPFLDGNGRLARVITSLILLSFNIPPPIITQLDDRAEYLSTLRNADSGDVKPLIIFIGNRIIQSLNYALILKHNSDG